MLWRIEQVRYVGTHWNSYSNTKNKMHSMLCSRFCRINIPDPVSQIPDPNFFRPGSQILDRGSNIFSDPGSWIRIRINNLSIFNPIFFLSSWKYDLGCSSRIRILIFHSGSRIAGSKRHWIPDPQHCLEHTVLVRNGKLNVTDCHDFRNAPESGRIFILWGVEDQGGLFSRNSLQCWVHTGTVVHIYGVFYSYRRRPHCNEIFIYLFPEWNCAASVPISTSI